ncbi:helix-turn-helix domain-containing protein [Paenibacillus sp. NPDC056579]|uniref:helix-turn-helix domain-containing protein n=1 Tax=Paenibacillus sp. NPDC056579 TaxID=3345871 RepID=UPI0036B5F663
MKPHLLSDYIPTITYYDYWERKEKFLLYEDRYTDWTLFAIEEGAIYYEFGEHKGTASFGDLLLCPPNTSFHRVVVEPASFHFVRLIWTHEKDPHANPEETVISGKITVQNTERLVANYTCLRSIPIVTTLAQGNRRNHYVRDLWYTFCSEEEPAEPYPTTLRSRKSDNLMKQAERRIRHNAFESFELRHIAAELGMSPAQLTKRFKASFGWTPSDYLTHLRLEKARSLLLETYLTLDQIAQCCGYENGFYLSRIFTKQYHMPPTDYRKSYRV